MRKKLLIILILALAIFPASKILAFNPIVINEIMYDFPGSDDGHEWVEIKNISANDIDLTGWKFNDGSNHNLNLPPKNGGQGSFLIPYGGYAIFADKADVFLVDHPDFSGIVIDTVMSLNNTAEILKVIDSDGQIVDQASYADTLGAKGDGYSLERKSDYVAGFCPSGDLAGSPGLDNHPDCDSKASPSITPDVASPTPDLISDFSASLTEEMPVSVPLPITAELVISEFIPNPVGLDEENEWVEIYNAGSDDVNLTGWKLEDASGKNYDFPNQEIKSRNYLVLSRGQTGISLNNNSETLVLIAPDGSEAFKISFTGGSKEGYSFSRFGSNDWRWTDILTPGKPNEYSGLNKQNSEQGLVIGSFQPTPSIESISGSVKEKEKLPMAKIVLAAAAVGLLFGVFAIIFLKKYSS